jgi:hypothetical protein
MPRGIVATGMCLPPVRGSASDRKLVDVLLVGLAAALLYPVPDACEPVGPVERDTDVVLGEDDLPADADPFRKHLD